MEVKISISDDGGAAVVRAAVPANSAMAAGTASSASNEAVAESGGVTDAGRAGGGISNASAPYTSSETPPDLLARAAMRNAINAGRAPDLSGMEAGTPPLFIAGN